MLLLLSFVGSLGAAILFNVKMDKLFWAGLSGTLGRMAFLWLYAHSGQVIFATFAGAAVVGIYSEIMARVLKTPATVFSISGIFPLVPGITAYEAIQYTAENKLLGAVDKIMDTFVEGMAIAFGIILATSFFRFIRKVGKHGAIGK